jgi:hypothetical protein
MHTHTEDHMTAFRTIRTTAESADALRLLSLEASARVGRRLTMSETLDAVCQVARQHPTELQAALTDGKTQ